MIDVTKTANTLKGILKSYPTAKDNRAQMNALLMDLLPDERLTRNLLLMALDEGIVIELCSAKTIDNIKLHKYVKALTTGYGITEVNANDVLSVWSRALGVEIQISKNEVVVAEHAVPITPAVEWLDSGRESLYEYESIEGGVRITKYIGFDEPEITIPNMLAGKRVLDISAHAFKGCISINRVVISEGIESIGNGVFMNIRQLKEVKLPSTLKSIGSSGKRSPFGGMMVDGAFSGTGLVNASIPNSVNYIGANTFSGCTALMHVSLPDSLECLESGLFFNCCKLKNITLPRQLKRIEDSAFYRCTGLSELVLPNGLTTIGAKAFDSCRNLKQISIPTSVHKIGLENSRSDNVFFLTSVTILCDAGSYAMDYARKNGIKCARKQ